jgi:hypothetical protein
MPYVPQAKRDFYYQMFQDTHRRQQARKDAARQTLRWGDFYSYVPCKELDCDDTLGLGAPYPESVVVTEVKRKMDDVLGKKT